MMVFKSTYTLLNREQSNWFLLCEVIGLTSLNLFPTGNEAHEFQLKKTKVRVFSNLFNSINITNKTECFSYKCECIVWAENIRKQTDLSCCNNFTLNNI